MEQELDFAKNLAHKAGEIMLKYFYPDVKQRIKEDETIVTIADEEINQLVIDEVEKAYPSYSVYGEEASSNKGSTSVWVCDPIDGTVPYSKGLPVSVFSLALVEDGVPVLGVIYNPFTKQLFSALKGGGSFINNLPIKVSELGLNRHSTVNVEWWPEAEFDVDTPLHQLSLATKSYVLHLGSVISASSLVASGCYEACVFAGTKGKNVDIAAVKIIVEEAGGKVTDLFGNEQRYDTDIRGAIITNGKCHEEVVELFT